MHADLSRIMDRKPSDTSNFSYGFYKYCDIFTLPHQSYSITVQEDFLLTNNAHIYAVILFSLWPIKHLWGKLRLLTGRLFNFSSQTLIYAINLDKWFENLTKHRINTFYCWCLLKMSYLWVHMSLFLHCLSVKCQNKSKNRPELKLKVNNGSHTVFSS